MNEAPLELLGEPEDPSVGFVEASLADHGDQSPEIPSLGVERVQLVGNGPMIGAGLAGADTGVHQSAEARAARRPAERHHDGGGRETARSGPR